jgi:hypothetical protein
MASFYVSDADWHSIGGILSVMIYRQLSRFREYPSEPEDVITKSQRLSLDEADRDGGTGRYRCA